MQNVPEPFGLLLLEKLTLEWGSKILQGPNSGLADNVPKSRCSSHRESKGRGKDRFFNWRFGKLSFYLKAGTWQLCIGKCTLSNAVCLGNFEMEPLGREGDSRTFPLNLILTPIPNWFPVLKSNILDFQLDYIT